MNRRNLWVGVALLAVIGVLALAWVRGGDRGTYVIEEPVTVPQAAD